MQLAAGAVWLTVASAASGELAGWSPADVSLRAGLAMVFLVLCGTVAAFAVAFGGITGGAFNPAVGLAPAILELAGGPGPSSLAWVYAVGPILGAAAAGFAYKFQESA